ncbi:unnamed protein product, partial [Mesorhabditis belari]|uniref:Uncharacterized protein n=1 Tax=Mesorhabditis belari TaxID=2138241 RepID=A0AAF3EJ02_9BILA
MEAIEKNRWQRFRELFVVAAITISMNGLYAFLLYSTDENAAFIQVITCHPNETYEHCRKRHPPKPDISLSFYFGYIKIIKQIEFWSLLLSCFTIPAAIYFSATNNGLKFPIRLFATAENFNRLLISLAMAIYQMPNAWLPFSILDNFSSFISDANLYVQQKLRKSGKASRVEILLMAQMISTSILSIFITIICQLNQLIASLRFGGNAYSMSLYTTGTAQAFAFQFVSSLLNALFLQKPKANRKKGAVTSVMTVSQSSKKQSQATNVTVSD